MSDMTKSKFKPGDRVVYTSWEKGHQAIGGTVIEVSARPHHNGVWSGINYYLLVILDTAEEVLDEHGLFYLESEYNPHIPF